MIRRCEFARALALIERSGVHTDLEELLRPPGKGGAPRQLRVEVFLAAALTAVHHKKTLSLVNIHQVLTRDLARSYQTALGVRVHGEAISIRQVRYLLEAIERKLAHTQGRRPDLADADRAERREALQNIMDKLLAATMPAHLPTHGRYAVDATAIESAARGKRSNRAAETAESLAVAAAENQASDDDIDAAALEGGRAFDPDARWGYRTKTYDNRTSSCFGYQVIAYTRIKPSRWDTDEPLLTERIAVVPANASAIEPALALLDRLRTTGPTTPVEIAADRGFSYAVEERWAYELRARGVDQVLDLHPNDHGVRDFDGVKMIAGTPHCPAMPEDLVDIRRPAQLSAGKLKANPTAREKAEHAAKVTALATFQADIAKREVYAFRRVTGPDPTGKERYECPARAGKIVCAHCPLSQNLPEGTPTVEDPPEADTAPTACQQRTITVPGDVTPKLRQQLRWGSPEWITSFSRRTHVEGGFGNLKNP
ncbi:MAG TPA: hypothetical protein VFS29_05050, partial [Motilibacteraceae bacterium]|nr:hypothetical protein [Motilibacteraceae bacterium]